MINPLDKRTTYAFEAINGLQRITQVEGHDSPSCAARERYRTYYTTGALQSATDWEGNVTHLERDDLGRVIRKTQGLRWSGDPQYGVITSGLDLVDTENANVKETCWHHSLNQPERVIENARVTIYKYDTHGRVVSRKVENRKVANGQCL